MDGETQPEERFEALWESASSAVSALVCSLIFDRHDAEDVVQEVAFTAAQKMDQYDPRRPFRSWALGISRNKVLKYYDGRKKDRMCFDSDVVERIVEVHGALEERWSDRSDALRACLSELRSKAAAVLDLRYRAGLSYEDVARSVGVSRKSAVVVAHRARVALRDCVRRRLGGSADTSNRD